MVKIISSNIKVIRKYFESHRIEKAYVFGSAVTGDFNEKSDLDFLVKFQPDSSLLLHNMIALCAW
jgi:predicted nucleotidyltransferase